MRRRLALALLLLLLATPAWAAWTSVGTLCTGTSTSSSSSVACTTGADAEAGNVVILIGAKDEASTSGTDAATSECDTVTDSAGGNTWTKAVEWMNAQAASAANGAINCIWYTKLTNQINSGGTITLNLAGGNVTSKAITAWEFTIGGGNTVSVAAATSNGRSDDAADPGSTSNSIDTSEYLYVRSIASESDSTTALTVTGSWTAFSQAVADAGASGVGMAARGEWRIASVSSAASDPTLFSADHSSSQVALRELSAGPCMGGLLLMGVGGC